MTIRDSPDVRSGRLRELRLHGFKTFADPTRFVFEPGINAVIGPNGSGKSNMADAVRWVLGEQSNRSLRTRRGDDVIFTGSQQRRPQGMAEAILTLDNFDGWLPIDFGEVSIGRRAYRSGESEYLINGAPARLRDVVDLLAGGRLGANELVVVGQGTVDAALSLRPEERRQLFEEAAGVKSLQVRKNEALARLARARDNLTRASDLIAELRPRARRLVLQAQHQQEHDSLGDRARWLVGALHRRREHVLQERAGEARRAAAAAEASLAAFRRDQESGRAEVLAAEGRYWTAEQSARAAAERREATRDAVIRAESRLESLAAREREAASTVAGLEPELAMVEEQLSEGLPDATHAEGAIAAARAAEARWRAAVAALRDAEDRSIALEEEAERARQAARTRARDVLQRVEQSAAIAARTRRLEDELADAREALVAATAESAVARSVAEAAASDSVDAEQELASARRQRDEVSGTAADGRRLADEVEARVRLMTAELAELRHRGDQAASVEGVLRTAGWRGLLDEIEPPPDAWLALEAVVGGELEHALLWRDDDLRPRLEAAGGVVHLLAAELQPPEDRAQAMAAVGGTQTLAEWLGLSNAPRLLRRAVVVPDLDALLAGWSRLPEGWVAVTPAGDLADARGVLTLHGRGEARSRVAARRHARLRELTALLAADRPRLTELAARSGQLARAADAARHEADVAQEPAAGARIAMDAARNEAGASDDRARRIAARVAELEAGLLRSQAESGSSRAAVGDGAATGDDAELRQLSRDAAAAEEVRAAAALERDAARDAWQAARTAADDAEAAVTGGARAREQGIARRAQVVASLAGLREALAALRRERAEAERSVNAARDADQRANAERVDAEQEWAAARAELLERERRTVAAGGRLVELEGALQAAAIDASRAEQELGALDRERDQAFDSLSAGEPGQDRVQLPDVTVAEADELAALDEEALSAELRRVRRSLAQLGAVNPFAVEEHREVAGRLDELTTQDEDLRAAIASTEELIATLDREIGERFHTAFAAIGRRFNEYCRLLFAGGSASLRVSDGTDGEAPGGIEIVVQPPGKRLQRLSMLSGGERALTGVALLFSMLSVSPVPFCILDEVDAALDEANIGRFAEALRTLSAQIDFVVITHNRATIEVADTIYGVTMTDAAVSRVLSLRLADVPVGATA